jgi:transposase
MTKSYSLDLHKRVAHFVETGHSCHEAARRFEVSVAFVVRLMAAYWAIGSLAPKPEVGCSLQSQFEPHRVGLFKHQSELAQSRSPNR